MNLLRFKYIVILLVVLNHVKGVSQDIHIPLPDSNATWVIGNYLGPNLQYVHEYYLDTQNRDTIIDGVIYSVLMASFNGVQNEFCGGLMDDGVGRVYYLHPNSDEAFLLYDFSLNVGDTVSIFAGSWIGQVFCNTPASELLIHSVEVFDVDTLVIMNQSRRRLWVREVVAPGDNQWWIEGIGGNRGLLTTNGAMTMSSIHGFTA